MHLLLRKALKPALENGQSGRRRQTRPQELRGQSLEKIVAQQAGPAGR